MVDHEHVREVYVELLRLLYSKVHASVPLLAASSAALERSIHDQVAAGMGDWLHEHASEEQHHDEWLLEDYTTIGRDPAELGRQAGSRPSRPWSVRCTIGCCTLTRRHPRVLRGPGMEPAVRGIHRSARGPYRLPRPCLLHIAPAFGRRRRPRSRGIRPPGPPPSLPGARRAHRPDHSTNRRSADRCGGRAAGGGIW